MRLERGHAELQHQAREEVLLPPGQVVVAEGHGARGFRSGPRAFEAWDSSMGATLSRAPARHAAASGPAAWQQESPESRMKLHENKNDHFKK